jgi:hypothetical protein
MQYLSLREQDRELIDAARAVIRNNYVAGRHHVGAAVREFDAMVAVTLEGQGTLERSLPAVTAGNSSTTTAATFLLLSFLGAM